MCPSLLQKLFKTIIILKQARNWNIYLMNYIQDVTRCGRGTFWYRFSREPQKARTAWITEQDRGNL